MTDMRNRRPLDVANAMYRFAFQTKKHPLSKKYPLLTEKELHKKIKPPNGRHNDEPGPSLP